MKRLFSSLYWRISAIFLVLLLGFGLTQLWLSVQSARNFVQESDQKLNRHLAAEMARAFKGFLQPALDRDGLARAVREMMVFNPRLEIYLLDEGGRVFADFSGGTAGTRARVGMEPIHKLLAKGKPLPLPIRGDDPRHEGRQKPFSVAPIQFGDRPGYLYVILSGEQYESIFAMVEESYIIRSSLATLLASFLLIGVAGLLVFFLLTKRLRAIIAVVRQFEQGKYGGRVPETTDDEIGQLGKAFNQMAGRIEANLEQMQKTDSLRRELVANVSHDLRSPLSSIQGHLETILMKDEGLPAAQRRRFLEIIYNNVTRLGRLVGELFELSKLDAKQVQPNKERFSLTELVQDVVLKFQPAAKKRRIRLQTAFSKNLAFVNGDIGMIERVLSNLIENALQHTQGEVTVKLEPNGNSIRVEVSDTGSGISEEDLPHIFDRFYRVDKSRSRASGGAGLGLAIARRILETHDSDISVRSDTETGTTFYFALAASDPPPPRKARS